VETAVSTQPFGRAPDGHLDVEVVSDLVEGLLTPEQAASVEEHLGDCEPCRDVRDALAEIHGTLGQERPRSAGVAGQRDAWTGINGTESPAFRSAPRETTASTGDAPGPTPPRPSPKSPSTDGGPSLPRIVTALVMIAAVAAVAVIVTLVLAAR
jgi:hypothetical protein